MVITRETDYALRILRALLDGKLHTAGQIAQDELLPQAFAYKILKKLEKAGLVEVVRGTAGGGRGGGMDLPMMQPRHMAMANGQ